MYKTGCFSWKFFIEKSLNIYKKLSLINLSLLVLGIFFLCFQGTSGNFRDIQKVIRK